MEKAAAVYHDPLVLTHDAGPHHPETPTRVLRCVERLRSEGCRVEAPPDPPRTLAAVERVHPQSYVERFRKAVASAPPAASKRAFSLFDCPDNPISRATFEAAFRTTGLALAAVDDVMAGREPAVFVAVRPPGHHALAAQAMGFCFFNTIAVLARDLLATHRLSRVLIADFDVHHGNGTQALFFRDPEVAYLSVHRYPFYPGTGAEDEVGEGAGRGTTVNVPRPAGSDDEAYAGGFGSALEALAERFRPEFVLVSAGFDADLRDPLGGMRVSPAGFARMTASLRQVAATFAASRIVSILEGGYDPDALGEAALAHLGELTGP